MHRDGAAAAPAGIDTAHLRAGGGGMCDALQIAARQARMIKRRRLWIGVAWTAKGRVMDKKPTSAWEGWSLVGAVTIALVLGVTIVALTTADPVTAVRRLIRMTARSSAVLFLLAFTASAAWYFWPTAWTRWQRANRRYLGVAFAVSHFVHLGAILALRRIAPSELADTEAVTWISGGLAYVFIAAMTATSFDSTARMVGPRAWTILHTVGSYYIWLIFANSYLSRAATEPAYVPAAMLVVFALGLRVAARIAKARGEMGTFPFSARGPGIRLRSPDR
jgi:DMSO/TMAO reductase YedYZ heme-binding membrane subunit